MCSKHSTGPYQRQLRLNLGMMIVMLVSCVRNLDAFSMNGRRSTTIPSLPRSLSFLVRPSSSSSSSLFSSSTTKEEEESITSSTTTTTTITNNNNNNPPKPYRHTVAILNMPLTSLDKIANEAILETALGKTSDKLSVVVRASNDNLHPSLASLRQSVGEVYSSLWDYAMGTHGKDNEEDDSGSSGDDDDMVDVVVYPQNLPNAAPESWLYILPDIDCICSHDSICGWESTKASGRGTAFQFQGGLGGLQSHVDAINQDRISRNLTTVVGLHVSPWPAGACAQFNDDHNVIFMDDEQLQDGIILQPPPSKQQSDTTTLQQENEIHNPQQPQQHDATDQDDTTSMGASLMGGAVIHSKSLFSQVCVGGTFDGMHYGHRKLLTLAISSVLPQNGGGKLMIGVTVDDMLQHKKYSEFIPPLEERMEGVRNFVHRLAPGLKNCIKIVPISDAFGPPGKANSDMAANFDALVLSHETLENGHLLNQYRTQTLGYKPLILLCTRRTEPHGMSSTQLRKLRSDKQQQQQQQQQLQLDEDEDGMS